MKSAGGLYHLHSFIKHLPTGYYAQHFPIFCSFQRRVRGGGLHAKNLAYELKMHVTCRESVWDRPGSPAHTVTVTAQRLFPSWGSLGLHRPLIQGKHAPPQTQRVTPDYLKQSWEPRDQ